MSNGIMDFTCKFFTSKDEFIKQVNVKDRLDLRKVRHGKIVLKYGKICISEKINYVLIERLNNLNRPSVLTKIN